MAPRSASRYRRTRTITGAQTGSEEVEVWFEPYDPEVSLELPPAPAQSLVFTVIRRHGAFVLQGVESLPAEPDPQ